MKNCLGGGAHNVALVFRAANPVVSVKKQFLVVVAQAAQLLVSRFLTRAGGANCAVKVV